jgi:twitching motility protein PilU
MSMQAIDVALYKLYNAGKISLEEALKNADGENNLRLKIKLSEKGELVSYILAVPLSL